MSFTLRAKRTLVGALAMTMVISLMPAGVASADEHGEVCDNAGDAGFTDTSASVHEDNINCMFAYGIGSGYDDDTFRPGNPITRDQMATLLASFAVVANEDLDIPDVDVPFTDIEGNVHAANIEALYALGVVSGQTETTYNPRGLVTRAQYATFVVQAHEALGVDFDVLLDEVDSPFTDIAGDTHEANIEILYSADLVVGQTATTYNPAGSVQRGQVMTVLKNSAEILDANGLWDAPRLDPVDPDPEDPTVNTTYTTAPELEQVLTYDAVRGRADFIFDTGENAVTGRALQTVDLIDEGLVDGAATVADVETTEDACVALGANNYSFESADLEGATVVDEQSCFLYTDFIMYDQEGNPAWPYEARISGNTVLARYYVDGGTVANDPVAQATRATVRYNAVESTGRVPSIQGDFPLTVIDPAAELDMFSPILESVSNRSLSPITIGDDNNVLVDFNFESPLTLAEVNAFLDVEDGDVDAGEFYLVGLQGAEWQGLTFFDRNLQSLVTNPSQLVGETTVSVIMAANVSDIPSSPNQISRGYVVTGGTAGEADPKELLDGEVTAVADALPVTSAQYVLGDGTFAANTTLPDLTTAQITSFNPNRIALNFDQAISDDPADYSNLRVGIFDAAGDVIFADDVFPIADPGADANILFADFAALTDDAEGPFFGAFVADGAVRATEFQAASNNGFNRPAWAPLSPDLDPEDDGVITGTTDKPDLVDVRVARNQVTQNFQVAFDFNEEIDADTLPLIDFDLYDEDGTRFNVPGATTIGRSVQSDGPGGGTTVVFSVDAGFVELNNEQIDAAATGAVQIRVLDENEVYTGSPLLNTVSVLAGIDGNALPGAITPVATPQAITEGQVGW